eukprot:tig00020675_g12700.t1
MMREVTYGLLPVPQRRSLHRALAHLYETRLKDAARAGEGEGEGQGEGEGDGEEDLESLSCISHHLLLDVNPTPDVSACGPDRAPVPASGESERAAPYLERSARLAVKSGAHVEALRLYEDLCGTGAAPAARRAEWTRRRAQSLHLMGLDPAKSDSETRRPAPRPGPDPLYPL